MEDPYIKFSGYHKAVATLVNACIGQQYTLFLLSLKIEMYMVILLIARFVISV
jgi:hypothetical protein